MYKLLLTTNDQAIREMFSAMEWEMMGFRAPRMASSVEEAVRSLKAHHADAVCVALPEAEDAALMLEMMDTYSDLPVMAAGRDRAETEKNVIELRKVLNRINADMSNTAFSTAEQLQVLRHEFFRALMDRRIDTAASVERLLRLMHSRMDAHRPCVVAELSMPEDSDFLKGRWHYGTERLELALRNILGVELNGMRILCCVLPGDRIVLLGCPMLFHEASDESDMIGLITNHVNDCIAHVEEFMGIDLFISSIRILPALTALAMEA